MSNTEPREKYKEVLKIHEEMEKKAYKKGKEDLKKSILGLLKNDSLAITYQSMKQYREALIAVIKTL